jgi:hypothetical protein
LTTAATAKAAGGHARRHNVSIETKKVEGLRYLERFGVRSKGIERPQKGDVVKLAWQ